MKKTKFQCAVCGKISAGRIPKDGDLSGRYPRRHYVNGIPCKGNIELAFWVDDLFLKLIKPITPIKTLILTLLLPLCSYGQTFNN